MSSHILPLDDGTFKATDDKGKSRVFDNAYEAQQWLWYQNIGRNPQDQQYIKKTDLMQDFEQETKEQKKKRKKKAEYYYSSYRIADWKDVSEKTRRLLDTNKLTIQELNTHHILTHTQGDHGSYTTYVTERARVHQRNDWTKTVWYCTCDWGQWCNSGERPHDGPLSTGSVKSNNRFCSHAYAAWLLLKQYQKKHPNRRKGR